MRNQNLKLSFTVDDKDYEKKIMFRVKQNIRQIAAFNDCLNTGSSGVIGGKCSMYFSVPVYRLKRFVSAMSKPFCFQIEELVPVQENTISYRLCCESPSFKLEKRIKKFSIKVYSSSY